jgi:hypothetical protein
MPIQDVVPFNKNNITESTLQYRDIVLKNLNKTIPKNGNEKENNIKLFKTIGTQTVSNSVSTQTEDIQEDISIIASKEPSTNMNMMEFVEKTITSLCECLSLNLSNENNNNKKQLILSCFKNNFKELKIFNNEPQSSKPVQNKRQTNVESCQSGFTSGVLSDADETDKTEYEKTQVWQVKRKRKKNTTYNTRKLTKYATKK